MSFSGRNNSTCTVESILLFRPVLLGVRAEPTVAGRREKQSPKAHSPGQRPGGGCYCDKRPACKGKSVIAAVNYAFAVAGRAFLSTVQFETIFVEPTLRKPIIQHCCLLSHTMSHRKRGKPLRSDCRRHIQTLRSSVPTSFRRRLS